MLLVVAFIVFVCVVIVGTMVNALHNWQNVRARRARRNDPASPPRCAQCGYQIITPRTQRRCPECGADLFQIGLEY